MVSAAEKLREFVEDDSAVGQVASTLAAGDFPVVPARLAALQLVGGVPFNQPTGEQLRSEIHLLIIAGSEFPASQFTRRFKKFTSNGKIINASASTRAGIVASAASDRVERGVVTDPNVDFTVIENADQFDSDITNALGEVLEVGEFSMANANVQETVTAPGSLLMFARPMYDNWDRYEPVEHQVEMSSTVLNKVDVAAIVNTDQSSPVADYIDKDTAEVLLEKARNVEPSIPEAVWELAESEAREIVERRQEMDDAHVRLNDGQVVRSILRLAAAEAKYDLRDEISEQDCKNATWLLQFAYSTVSFEENQEDAEIIDTNESDGITDTDRVAAVISSIEDQHDEGAPTDEVIDQARDRLGLSGDKVKEEIHSLRKKGELYEPVQGHLRTTQNIDESVILGHQSERRSIKSLKSIVGELEEEYLEGAPVNEVLARCEELGMDREKAEQELESLRKKAELYEPAEGHLRTT